MALRRIKYKVRHWIGGGDGLTTTRMRRFTVRYTINRIVFMILLYIGFMTEPRNESINYYVIIAFVVLTVFFIGFIVAQYKGFIKTLHGIYVDLIYYLFAFTGMFSAVYWNYGTSQNFSTPLTHLDALYFTIGTLSTAGTGNIAPVSELARGLQCTQMVLDLAFFSVAVALVVTRLGSSFGTKSGSNPK